MEGNGALGRVPIDDTVRRYQFQAAGNETREVWQAGYFNNVDREFHRTLDKHMNQVLEAFRAEAEPPVHAQAGRRALALANAAITSYEMGSRIIIGP